MSPSPRVFVPNLPTRFDAATEKHVPSVDINSASQFGQITTVTKGHISVGDHEAALNQLKEAADEFVEGVDLVLSVGDVVYTAALLLYLHSRGKRINMLRYTRRERRYDVVEITV